MYVQSCSQYGTHNIGSGNETSIQDVGTLSREISTLENTPTPLHEEPLKFIAVSVFQEISLTLHC